MPDDPNTTQDTQTLNSSPTPPSDTPKTVPEVQNAPMDGSNLESTNNPLDTGNAGTVEPQNGHENQDSSSGEAESKPVSEPVQAIASPMFFPYNACELNGFYFYAQKEKSNNSRHGGRHHSALKANKKNILKIKPEFQRGILAIELIPGLEPDLILGLLESGKCKGILLKSFGAGNVPTMGEYSLLEMIRKAVSVLKLPVLISTKFVNGQTHMGLYETGKMAMDAGAIPTGDLTDVMAQVKLMWALAQGPKSLRELKKIINTDFVGEITV